MEEETPRKEPYGPIEIEGSYGLNNAKILVPTQSLRWKITKVKHNPDAKIHGGYGHEVHTLEQLYQDVNSSYYEWRPIEIVYEEN